jgi:hypothetical protein
LQKKQVYKWQYYISFGYMPKSSTTVSYGSSIFSFMRNFHTAFHSGCTNLHSHQQCMKVAVSLHLCHHLFLFVFFMIAILSGVRWNLNGVLICICIMARDVEHFFIYLLAIYTSSFENCQFSSLAHFFIGLLVHWEFSFLSSNKFWLLIPCQMCSWQRLSSIL